MNTTFNLWVNNKPRAKDGAFDIFIRVTQDRKHKSLKTGISVSSVSDFNPKAKSKNWIRGRDGSVKKLNDELAIQLERIASHYRQLQGKNEAPSKERIIHSYRGKESANYLHFLRKIIDRFIASGGYRSAKRYNQLYNKLIEFNGAKSDLPFDQITVSFLKDFQTSLSDLHQNTIYEHFKNLKASFNQAIEEDIISPEDSPFRKFKVNRVSTHKEKLTEEELRRLKGLELVPGSGLWHTLNCFLFSFYCGGIRAGDLICLRWENVVDDSISYVMAKTRKKKLIRKTVPLIPESSDILSRYESANLGSGDFIFQQLDSSYSKLIDQEGKIKPGYEKVVYNKIGSRNAILNKNLKALAKMTLIEKPLTFHIARHSFAQYALNKEINPKILQTILGHEKFSTTENYISGLDGKKVEEAMLKIFN
ncbi:MAG: site-specific integrase [Bacteroidia bacterium]